MNLEQELKSALGMGQVPLRTRVQDLSNDSEYVFSSLFRWDKRLNLVSIGGESNAVVVLNRRERQKGCYLGGGRKLKLFSAAKSLRARGINQQENRQFPFLYKLFDEHSVHTRRNVPVDDADVVSGLIFSDLRKVHTSPFEHGVILTRELVVHRSLRSD